MVDRVYRGNSVINHASDRFTSKTVRSQMDTTTFWVTDRIRKGRSGILYPQITVAHVLQRSLSRLDH